ncbi:MAG: hypothetical protein LC749_00440 [Actinobacteria bacterium]|nr:hypothetical protein [Actinomycetota bacterium]
MLGLIVALLVIWLIVACIGIAIKGLLWLFVIGLVLFALTTAFGAFSITR